jgi:hypothetical protein
VDSSFVSFVRVKAEVRMDPKTCVADLEGKRAYLLQNAAQIVQRATAMARELTRDEDSHVLELIKQAQLIEEELLRFKRHPKRTGPSPQAT